MFALVKDTKTFDEAHNVERMRLQKAITNSKID